MFSGLDPRTENRQRLRDDREEEGYNSLAPCPSSRAFNRPLIINDPRGKGALVDSHGLIEEIQGYDDPSRGGAADAAVVR